MADINHIDETALNESSIANESQIKKDTNMLLEIVRGNDKIFTRKYAMTLLQKSDFPNKHEEFEELLNDEKEDSRIRYHAAMNLWKINTKESIESLINSGHIRDDLILSGVMMALGRIGGESSLELIGKVGKTVTGIAASQAKFAAVLISHRLGLEGNDLPVPNNRDYLVKLSKARSILINPAENAETQLCLSSLANQPYGIEFSEGPKYMINCGRNELMLLFNKEFSRDDAAEKMAERKAFLSLIARKSQTDNTYSPSALVLTSPSRLKKDIDILIYSPKGNVIMGGQARKNKNRALFSIRTISKPGAVPVQIEGEFEIGKIKIKTALSSRHIYNKRRPMECVRINNFTAT
jgi:hypothetical protein